MKIVVVGDVLLDVEMKGDANRLCPDAPVPVVDVEAVERRAGGAGLVASMLAADGADVELVTVLSDDENSGALRTALEGVPVVAGPSGAPTPVKSRVWAGRQTVVRLDEGCAPAPVPEVDERMLAALKSADTIIVADYGRGLTVNAVLRSALEELARRIPVVWDPHPAGSAPVPGVAAVTPNQSEARKMAGEGERTGEVEGRTGEVEGGIGDGAEDAAAGLRRRWQSRTIAVTLGAAGVLLLDHRGSRVVPAPRVAVADPCGAGDRFAASLALSLGEGRDIDEAAARAAEDAAAFLAAGGVASLPRAPFGGKPEPRMLGGDRVDARRLVRQVRSSGGTVVATGGCFDLLHAGHVRTLSAARRLGDCLIVCLNSDASVRRLKGSERPIIGEQDRVELLAALECVDAVVLFDEDTPEAVLEALQPDLWVKGGDYSPDDLPEATLMKTWGGRTVTVPYHPARSTTGLASALARVG